MAGTVLKDTFTDTADTDITAHVGEVNAPWSYFENNASLVISDANRVRIDSTVPGSVKAKTVGYASDDFDLSVTYFCKTVRPTQWTGIGWKYNGMPSGFGATYYRLYYQHSVPQWLLEKKVSDVNTTIGTFIQTLSADTAYGVAVKVLGSRIQVFIDGVPRIDVTDSAIPEAGRVVLDFYDDNGGGAPGSNTVGVHIDNLRVDEATSVPFFTTVGGRLISATR